MTDDQLEGRDLDRACAEAMHGPSIIWRHWSTDPSTQAEKLAWLLAMSVDHDTVDLLVDQRRVDALITVSWDDVVPLRAQGATIDQALARLVCSVAKAKKEQGK